MIEKTIIDYLMAADLSVGQNIYFDTPVNPPDEYILIDKTGSGETNQIRQAMVAVRSISRTSKYHAACINEEVITAMKGIIYSTDIFRCDLNSDYDFTNTQTKEFRYQAVFDITY